MTDTPDLDARAREIVADWFGPEEDDAWAWHRVEGATLPEDIAALAREAFALGQASQQTLLAEDAASESPRADALQAERDELARQLAEVTRQRDFYESALFDVAEVGDGFGSRNRRSGTNGEGHAQCLEIADGALDIKWEDLPHDSNEADASPLRVRHRAKQQAGG